MAARSGRILIWDLPTRLFHWLLVVALAVSWLTAEVDTGNFELHFYSGYSVIGLLLFRIAWGFVGPRHARFGSFVRGPAQVWRYARQLLSSVPAAVPGHNPLGAVSVLLMLVLLAVQVGSGLFLSDDVFYYAPYNPLVSAATADLLHQVHEVNFILLQIVAGLHVLAIGFYWGVKKQNLLGPMLSGYKSARDVDPDTAIRQRWLAAVLVLLTVAAAIALLLALAPEPVLDDYL